MKNIFSYRFFSSTVLSENPTSFTITVTSEAGENDESKLNASQRLCGGEKPLRENNFVQIIESESRLFQYGTVTGLEICDANIGVCPQKIQV